LKEGAMSPNHASEVAFRRPSGIERAFNRCLGVLVGLGFGREHYYLLQVRGRKSGRVYSAPVYVIDMAGRRYLVCPRGRSQWVRNAEASGKVTLKKGRDCREFALRSVAEGEKLEILKTYLDRFKTFVQRYFPLPAGSPAAAFVPIADRYPVYELISGA
jgi:deazaflavin-dependent oxidoreductase (nitroreductase family)